MTKLMQEILADPAATFEIEADLPSGNMIVGTVGPLIGNKMQAQVGFKRTATDEDMRLARYILDRMIGLPPKRTIETHSAHELEAAHREGIKFMGGGKG